MKYKIILIIFSIFEIIALSYPEISIVLSLIEYLTILSLSIVDMRKAAQLFIMLNLISFGEWTYINQEIINYSYLNIRFDGISINFLVSVIFIFGLAKRKIPKVYHRKILYMSVSIIALSVLSFIVNIFDHKIIYTATIKDLKFISFIVTSLLLVKFSGIYKKASLLNMLIFISIFQNIICILTDVNFDYGSGNEYLPINTISYFFPVILFFPSNKFKNFERTTILFIFFSGYFFSGKAILMFFLSFILWIYQFIPKSKSFYMAITTSFILLYITIRFGNSLLDFEISDPIINYKFNQFKQLFNPNSFEILINSQTSIGNIFAEIITFINTSKKEILKFFIGYGLGGGMPDTMGLLYNFAGKGGYSIDSLSMNSYYSMHLPTTQILLKTGIVGFLIYISIFYEIHKIKISRSIKVLFIASFLLVFYVTKENILFHLVLINIILYGNTRLHKQ